MLVTGASGFLGEAVCAELLARGLRVIAFTELSSLFDPRLRGKTPVRSEFTKRDRIHRTSYVYLLTAQVERHGRGGDDICVIAVEIDVSVARRAQAVA